MPIPEANTLEKDFIISDQTADFPLPEYPAFLDFGLIAVCRSGEAGLLVHGRKSRLTANHLLILFPQQTAALSDTSDDFAVTFCAIPQALFHDVISMMRRFTPHFLFFMQENYLFPLTGTDRADLDFFLRRLAQRASAPQEDLRRELVIFSLAVFYMDLYQYYKEKSKLSSPPVNQRKEELTYEFFRLVADHHVAHKDVAFYADKMNITPTYLTIVVKETSGLSAKEWLIEYLTQKIKSKLRDPRLNMQEIALELNFPTQTAMNRFFRNYTGMSLTQYRKSITT